MEKFINKYPLEIEFTDYCGLKCESCVNPLLQEKGYLSRKNYEAILDYIFANKDKILYINFAGIGDMFLHPNINDFLEYFIQKFKDTNIHVLIPTKGQSLNDTHILLLKKMQDS
jgi:DNA repair photolyase